MRDLGTIESLTPGAIGEPGDRTFYLQVAADEGTSWFLLEKGQVAALGEQALELLDTAGLAGAGAELSPAPLEEPGDVVFRVGAMQLSYSEETGLVEIILASTDEDLEPVAFTLTPSQLDVAARAGLAATAAGRPPCPRCGLAMDPSGHICPTTNGDLRQHRP